MWVRCLGFECNNMIPDTVSHGTCSHCVEAEAALMEGVATTIDFPMQLDMTVVASDSHLIVGVANKFDAERVFQALYAAGTVDDGCLVVKHDVDDGNPYEVIATAEDLFA